MVGCEESQRARINESERVLCREEQSGIQSIELESGGGRKTMVFALSPSVLYPGPQLIGGCHCQGGAPKSVLYGDALREAFY